MRSKPSLKGQFLDDKEGVLLWNQERTILDITELICEVMEQEGVSRAELAKRLGKTKGYVTQLLDGTTNMTARTISDVFCVLGYEFHPTKKRMDDSANHFEIRVPIAPFETGWQPQFKVLAK